MPQLDITMIVDIIIIILILFCVLLFIVLRYFQFFRKNIIFNFLKKVNKIKFYLFFELLNSLRYQFKTYLLKYFFSSKKSRLQAIQIILKEHIINYPTPINFNYMWSFGSLAGLYFLIQIITGVFLAMHYTPHVDHAFLSVEHIMRDVNYGWFFRYAHANGASFLL